MSGKWDVERIVLVGMLLLIIGGLGFIWYERGLSRELASGMVGAEKNLASIGAITGEVQVLQEEMNDDILASGKLDSYAYIERQLTAVRLGKTSFSIAPPKEDRHEKEGYVDTSYPLNQAGRETFTREELGMFLLYIEGNTTRMKVTAIRIERAKGEADTDGWKARLTITDRKPITKS